jgi:hypothetical protein
MDRETAQVALIKAFPFRAESHWERHNPRFYQALQKKGILQQALQRAVAATILSLHQSQKAGLSPDRARELAYPNWQKPDEKQLLHLEDFCRQAAIKALIVLRSCLYCWPLTGLRR